MEQIPKWVEVAFGTVFWGGAMLFWTTRRRKAANIVPACSYVDVLYWGCGGFAFGILMSFGWQSFHRPWVYLLLLAFVISMLIGPLNPARRLK